MTIGNFHYNMQSPSKNNEQYALVTGATSGFGFEFSKLLALHGYNLILVARSLDKLRDVAEVITENYRVKIVLLAKDLFNPEAAKDIYRTIKDMGIDVDVLINDSGKSEYGKFVEYDIDRDIDIIHINITSVVSLTKYFLKDMIARNRGKILQISSMLGSYPTPLMSVYAASKAFVLAFTGGLINELKNTNVTVSALVPGAIGSDFFHMAEGQHSELVGHQDLSVPEDVAKDGYEALMSGESKIISSCKSKITDLEDEQIP
jgi:short-subunit dehydrogenase